MIGPTTITLKICNNCDYFERNVSLGYILIYCNHPDLPAPRYIQDDRNDNVETREWCPEVNKK